MGRALSGWGDPHASDRLPICCLWCSGVPSSGELRVLPAPVTAPDVDNVTVIDEPGDQRRRHHVVAEVLAHSSMPLFLVRIVEVCPSGE